MKSASKIDIESIFTMVEPQKSEELSAEELSEISGGAFPGTVCPSFVDPKREKKTNRINEDPYKHDKLSPKKAENVSGQVVN